MCEGDFSEVSRDYAVYRDKLPDIFFSHLASRGLRLAGLQVIDLGCGTGLFTRALTEHGARVTGIDSSAELLDAARKADSESTYILDRAEVFSCVEPVDLITAVRAWHWFDREAVLERVTQALKNDGKLLVVNSVYLSGSPVVKLTYDIAGSLGIQVKPPGSMGPADQRVNGFPPGWYDEWQDWGFAVTHAWEHEYSLSYTPKQWAGKVRSVSWMAAAGAGKREAMTRLLAEALTAGEPELCDVPHRCSAVLLSRLG